jgi:predicted nucleic acid-binding protein
MKAKKKRIVLDTNVVISALLFGGELDEIRKL